MPRSYSKNKGRAVRGSFLLLPHAVINHPNYLALSIYARALLIEIASQYKGANNGDLTAAPKIMKARGWSESTVGRKAQELLQAGFIQKTRQGGRNKCNLYAITWQPIDDCNGKLDVKATNTASNIWKI